MATVVIQKYSGKSGKNSYAVRYKDPVTLKTKHDKSFKRKKDALNRKNELARLIDTGRVNEIKKNKRLVLTFSEVTKELKEIWEKRLRRRELSSNTVQGYQDLLKPLDEEFGGKLLGEIKSMNIENYRDSVAAKSSPVLANRRLFIIQQVFKLGVEKKTIFDNPAAKVKKLSERAHERNRYLLPGQIKSLVSCSRKTRAKYYLPVLIYLAVEHGTSKQEALSLKWSDIDHSIEGEGMIRFFRTKNKKERTQLIMPRTKKALIEWQEHLLHARHRRKTKVAKNDYVFCHLDGNQIKSFKKSWKKACELAGFSNLHYHDLRHTYCSNILLSGGGLKEIREMIGHDDISMTDRYTHLHTHQIQKRQRALAKHYWDEDEDED